METLKLKAEIREKTGGLSSTKAIYENKLVPGVVYGGKDAPVAIQVKNNELLKIINNESVFNSLVELELADKKHNVVFKDVQKHPSKNIFIHFDLQKVSKGTKINVTVPVVLTNQDKCFGIKIEGGVINHVLKELSVIPDQDNIPEYKEVFQMLSNCLLEGCILYLELPIINNYFSRKQWHVAHPIHYSKESIFSLIEDKGVP